MIFNEIAKRYPPGMQDKNELNLSECSSDHGGDNLGSLVSFEYKEEIPTSYAINDGGGDGVMDGIDPDNLLAPDD